MFDPDAHMPRINRGMIYLGACLIVGIRFARERQVNVRVVPTRQAIEESVDLAREIFDRVFRKVPEQIKEIHSWVETGDGNRRPYRDHKFSSISPPFTLLALQPISTF
jgi:hypothetical protein